MRDLFAVFPQISKKPTFWLLAFGASMSSLCGYGLAIWIPSVLIRSFDIDIRCSYAAGDEGILVAHGDQGGGYVVWVEDGAVHVGHNDGRGRFSSTPPFALSDATASPH